MIKTVLKRLLFIVLVFSVTFPTSVQASEKYLTITEDTRTEIFKLLLEKDDTLKNKEDLVRPTIKVVDKKIKDSINVEYFLNENHQEKIKVSKLTDKAVHDLKTKEFVKFFIFLVFVVIIVLTVMFLVSLKDEDLEEEKEP